MSRGPGDSGQEEAAPPDLAGLALLLDGYLHQDFRTEHGDHEAAARAFAREASEAEREGAVETLERFLAWADGVADYDWQDALGRAGGSWRPRSLGPIREVLAVVAGGDGP
jgi:hypothetical protein